MTGTLSGNAFSISALDAGVYVALIVSHVGIVGSRYLGIPPPIVAVTSSLGKSVGILLQLFVGSAETYYLYASEVLTVSLQILWVYNLRISKLRVRFSPTDQLPIISAGLNRLYCP